MAYDYLFAALVILMLELGEKQNQQEKIDLINISKDFHGHIILSALRASKSESVECEETAQYIYNEMRK